jgi:hypothetical protein
VLGTAGLAYVTWQSDCTQWDLQERDSPDAAWTARATVEACHGGLFEDANFVSRVSLMRRAAGGHKFQRVFRAVGSSARAELTWRSARELEIELEDAATVQTSERRVDDVEVRYAIAPGVLADVDGELLHRAHERAAPAAAEHGDPKMRRTLAKRNAEDEVYLRAFKQWARDTASAQAAAPRSP